MDHMDRIWCYIIYRGKIDCQSILWLVSVLAFVRVKRTTICCNDPNWFLGWDIFVCSRHWMSIVFLMVFKLMGSTFLWCCESFFISILIFEYYNKIIYVRGRGTWTNMWVDKSHFLFAISEISSNFLFKEEVVFHLLFFFFLFGYYTKLTDWLIFFFVG